MITKYLLYLTIFSLPLYVIRFKLGPVPFTFLEILILLTFLSWLIQKTITYLKKKEKPVLGALKSPRNVLILLSVGWILIGCIEVMFTPDTRGGLGILKAYIIEPVLLFWVMVDLIQKKEQLRAVAVALLLSAFVIAALAILQQFTGWGLLAPYEIAQMRSSALYNSANAVGLYIGPVIGLILPFVMLGKASIGTLRFKTSTAIFIVVGLVAIYFTRSSGAYVAIAAQIALLILLQVLYRNTQLFTRWISRVALFMGGIFVIGTIILFIFIPNATPNYPVKPLVRQNPDTFQVRLCVWEGTRKMLLAKPIFGAGLNGFHDTYKDYYTCDPELLQYPHTIFLNFWSELGLLGLLLFIAIVFYYYRLVIVAIKTTIRRPGADDKLRVCGFGLMLAMGYWLVHGLVDVPYFKNDLSVEFWIMLALATCYHGLVVSEEGGV